MELVALDECFDNCNGKVRKTWTKELTVGEKIIGENFNLLVVDSKGKIRNIKACGCHLKWLKRGNKFVCRKSFFSVSCILDISLTEMCGHGRLVCDYMEILALAIAWVWYYYNYTYNFYYYYYYCYHFDISTYLLILFCFLINFKLFIGNCVIRFFWQGSDFTSGRSEEDGQATWE